MSVKDMKAERDAKLAQREAEKAESPVASPRTQDVPAFLPSAMRQPAVASPASPTASRPADAPPNWDSMSKIEQIKWKKEWESMSKLEQIKWKKENRSRAQVNWDHGVTKVKVIAAFNDAGANTAPEEQGGLPANWAEMSTIDRIKWKREHGQTAESPQASPTASPRTSAARATSPEETRRAKPAPAPAPAPARGKQGSSEG